jgi:hypothetical protein
MSIVAQTLSPLAVGAPASHRGPAVLPLSAAPAGEPFYLTLDEALAEGSLRVTEVSGAWGVSPLHCSPGLKQPSSSGPPPMGVRWAARSDAHQRKRRAPWRLASPTRVGPSLQAGGRS